MRHESYEVCTFTQSNRSLHDSAMPNPFSRAAGMFYTDAMSDTQQRFSLISDHSLAGLRKLIGVPIEDSLEPWCYEASRDNIRHWAHGIGDDNPLWCDPNYAARTGFGRVQAPPSFIFPLNRSFSGYVGGLAGVHAMFAGIDVTWHRPMMLGDAFTTKVWLKDLVQHQTRFAGRSIQQIYRCEFYDQNRELVAEGDSWCFRTERDTARERGTKYEEVKKRAPVRYTREDLAKIFAHYEAEEVRGATPRYIEDVTAGDKLQTMVKGPMTVTGFIAFAQGWGGLYIRANKLAWKQLQKHPGLGIPNKFGIPDVPERVRVRTPTYGSFAALKSMFAGGTVAEIPIVLWSIDPCFACNDRVTLVDSKTGQASKLTLDEIRRLRR